MLRKAGSLFWLIILELHWSTAGRLLWFGYLMRPEDGERMITLQVGSRDRGARHDSGFYSQPLLKTSFWGSWSSD